jgi:hypothetical protein
MGNHEAEERFPSPVSQHICPNFPGNKVHMVANDCSAGDPDPGEWLWSLVGSDFGLLWSTKSTTAAGVGEVFTYRLIPFTWTFFERGEEFGDCSVFVVLANKYKSHCTGENKTANKIKIRSSLMHQTTENKQQTHNIHSTSTLPLQSQKRFCL